MSNIPLIVVDKRVFDYVDEKSINLKLVNVFGKDFSGAGIKVTYKLKPVKEAKGEYDLDEDVTVDESELTANVDPANPSSVSLDLSKIIKGPGKYTVQTTFSITDHTANKSYTLRNEFLITSLSKVKLNHLKMSVTNTQEKNDEKEITVEHPKRTFKSIKATQSSVVNIKVKLNYGDKQVSRIEQMFLRLRHSEIGKTYSAYVSTYKTADDYYYINFDMSDSVSYYFYEF